MLTHVLTRHNVAMLLPAQLGICEPQHPVILSEACCQADEPICWQCLLDVKCSWRHETISDKSDRAGVSPVSGKP